MWMMVSGDKFCSGLGRFLLEFQSGEMFTSMETRLLGRFTYFYILFNSNTTSKQCRGRPAFQAPPTGQPIETTCAPHTLAPREIQWRT